MIKSRFAVMLQLYMDAYNYSGREICRQSGLSVRGLEPYMHPSKTSSKAGGYTVSSLKLFLWMLSPHQEGTMKTKVTTGELGDDR